MARELKTELFRTEPHGYQRVSHITDLGDHSEPPDLCGNSLVEVRDDEAALTLTAEELADLSKRFLKGLPIESQFGHYTDDGGEDSQRRNAQRRTGAGPTGE